MKIFLGGTCNDTTWRDRLIKMLPSEVDYFNPVVEDWTPECQEREEDEKWNICDLHLYVITPKMSGVFSIAETTESAIQLGNNMIFCYLAEDEGLSFEKGQIKSLEAVGKLVMKYGGHFCKSLEEVNNEIKSILLNIIQGL